MSEQAAGASPSPTEFLALAGHPLRWRLLAELARSDRTVHELVSSTGEPQNLVSYHLGKLRKGELVSARRSSADGRDSYYRADLARIGGLLAAAGAALHPGLRLVPTRLEVPRPTSPVTVLFTCTGNSARSPMAAALLNARGGGSVRAISAGSHPKQIHPDAVRVVREMVGVDISDHQPTPIDAVAGQRISWVITLCDRVREVCPELPSHPEAVHWSIPNPVDDGPTGSTARQRQKRFLDVATELDRRIGFLLPVITEPSAPRRRPKGEP